MVRRLSITPAPELAQRPSAKHLSLREWVRASALRSAERVKGKSSVEHAELNISQGLLSGNRLIVSR
jgi:hypothetical protein